MEINCTKWQKQFWRLKGISEIQILDYGRWSQVHKYFIEQFSDVTLYAESYSECPGIDHKSDIAMGRTNNKASFTLFHNTSN
jgi:hypothetical protein